MCALFKSLNQSVSYQWTFVVRLPEDCFVISLIQLCWCEWCHFETRVWIKWLPWACSNCESVCFQLVWEGVVSWWTWAPRNPCQQFWEAPDVRQSVCMDHIGEYSFNQIISPFSPWILNVGLSRCMFVFGYQRTQEDPLPDGNPMCSSRMW